MKVTKDLERLSRGDSPIVTIGNFDGVHLGHQALLKEIVTKAQGVGGESVVLTFHPHPLVVISPHLEVQFLTTLDEKLSLFEQAGITHAICLEFTSQLAEISPATFVNDILNNRIGVCELCVGTTFRFGKDRAGTIEDLIRLGPGMGFHVTPILPVQNGGEIVSSSTIRKCIREGRVSDARRFLGRQYTIAGVVQKGEQNGVAMGYPTANLPLPADRVIPPNGVYATIATIDATCHHSVSYIGTRPTFHGTERLLEVHIFDMESNLYGKHITLGFSEYVRGDMVFSDATSLSRQIENDVRHARQTLAVSETLAY
jgi:riboflavin kinase/FMN adenylyltransferase